MKRLVDPNKPPEVTKEEAETSLPKVVSNDVDLKDLLSYSKVGLYREVHNLVQKTVEGLLSKEESQSLVNYVKLLQGLVTEEKELLDNLTEEELERLLSSKK